LHGPSLGSALTVITELPRPDYMSIVNRLFEERLEVREQFSPPERPERIASRRDDV
jgi:hypothetical protein